MGDHRPDTHRLAQGHARRRSPSTRPDRPGLTEADALLDGRAHGWRRSADERGHLVRAGHQARRDRGGAARAAAPAPRRNQGARAGAGPEPRRGRRSRMEGGDRQPARAGGPLPRLADHPVRGRGRAHDPRRVATVELRGAQRGGASASIREQVEIDLGPEHLERLGTIVDPVLVAGMPTIVWSPARPRRGGEALCR